MCFLLLALPNMTHRSFFSCFCWFAIWFMVLHPKLLSTVATPWPEITEPDVASRDPCGDNIAKIRPWTVAVPSNDPRSNVDVLSLMDITMQSLPIGDATSDAKMCAIGDAGVKLPEGSPSLCGDEVETVFLGKASESHNSNLLEFIKAQNTKLPQHACRLNPTMSLQQDHDSTPVGHDAGVFEAELKKGSKPPGAGQPSPIHNSVPDSETLNQVDVSLKSKGLGLLKEPSGGGHGQKLSAKKGHSGDSFVIICDLQNVLARNTGRPGAGSPSKGHNSVVDGVASE